MKQKYILCTVGLVVLLFSGCSQQQSQVEHIETQNTSITPQSSDNSTGSTGINSSTDVEMITAEEAKGKALEHAGLSSDAVTFVKSKLDYEDGYQIYDVEFYSNDYKEYDYEIDAYTGEVLGFDYEAEGYTPPASTDDGSMITEEKAKELALAKVLGATASDIREFEIDYDDGHTKYEGTIIYNGIEYEFEIDAYSGDFQSWEEEPVGR